MPINYLRQVLRTPLHPLLKIIIASRSEVETSIQRKREAVGQNILSTCRPRFSSALPFARRPCIDTPAFRVQAAVSSFFDAKGFQFRTMELKSTKCSLLNKWTTREIFVGPLLTHFRQCGLRHFNNTKFWNVPRPGDVESATSPEKDENMHLKHSSKIPSDE